MGFILVLICITDEIIVEIIWEPAIRFPTFIIISPFLIWTVQHIFIKWHLMDIGFISDHMTEL